MKTKRGIVFKKYGTNKSIFKIKSILELDNGHLSNQEFSKCVDLFNRKTIDFILVDMSPKNEDEIFEVKLWDENSKPKITYRKKELKDL